MIVTKLMGGLGNQMFQYAAAKSLALKNNTNLFLDLNFLLDRTPRVNFTFRDFDLSVFNTTYTIANKSILKNFLGSDSAFENFIIKARRKIVNKKFHYYHEPFFHFNPEFNNLQDNYYLEGYFQSERYFSEYADVIRKDFSPSTPPPDKVKVLLEKIHSEEQAVCLNVRRGDFVSNPLMNIEHGVLGLDYYYNAVQEITTRNKNAHIYVFSDDINWCANNLKFDVPSTFVDHTYAGEKYGSYLLLMQACRHFIIPNSTFGWWAAWLSYHPDKIVIAPARWFNNATRNTKDILPDSWIKL
ncbi:MAG: alpha-1,2-fucosyltransferase [Bacteroidetes bacterium]|nr:alpha-1,2-fucosyltransferase [Bacteroidota bacterium]